ncbi:MAG: hypothetical protein D6803_03865 [Anaerolineae bacterium]|nr:MAG: hypothetical protein D6803_03865 [Anaerolineae bacterium]
MDYQEEIVAARNDPRALELCYRRAVQAGEQDAFRQAVEALFMQEQDNLLLAAWHYRLDAADEGQGDERRSLQHWGAALLFSILSGLVFWALSDENLLLHGVMPYLALFWAPLAAGFVGGFLKVIDRQQMRRTLWGGAALLGLCVLVVLLSGGLPSREGREGYLTLMVFHLPLMAWAATGIGVLGLGSPPRRRFAFLSKSVEAVVAAGLYVIFGGVLAAITFGLFETLGVDIPEVVFRLIFAGGAGMVAVMSVATIYDPGRLPEAQQFGRGLSGFLATLLRLMLALALVVLIVFLLFVPFRFFEPFQQRDVLIVYNVLLFAQVGLLIGVTPVHPENLSPVLRLWLRRGVLALALLGVVIGLYALSAVVYRTFDGGLTRNRLTVIGWNLINIVILLRFLLAQWRNSASDWVSALQAAFSWGTNLYLGWGTSLVVFVPLLFPD